MCSDYKRVAVGARMVHMAVLLCGTVALFPVLDELVRYVLSAHTIPHYSTLGYTGVLILGSVSCAALLALVAEHLHLHMTIRGHSHEDAQVYVQHVREEYARIAHCSWYQYAMRTGCLFTIIAIVAGVHENSGLLAAFVAACGVTACLLIMRSSYA